MKLHSTKKLQVSPTPKIKTLLVSPAWQLKSQKEFNEGLNTLKNLGLDILNPNFRRKEESPRKKADEIMKAFLTCGDIPLILAIRGGYGSMKTLPLIDFDKLKKIKHPKILCGFSDISALLNPIYEKSGLIGIHSPMLWNFSNKKLSISTIKSFMNAIHGFPEKNLFKYARDIRIFRRGQPPYKTNGILKGGNMVTLGALIGTPWETNTAGTILFLEDVDEKKHEVDRMFTQWALAGKFDKIQGLILGDFRGVKPQEVFSIFEFSYMKLLKRKKIEFPVLHCPYLGHTTHKITLPVGLKVALDTNPHNKKPSLTIIDDKLKYILRKFKALSSKSE